MSTTNFFDTVALPRELRNALKVEIAEPDGSGGGGAPPSNATPEALGTADAGTSDEYSRGDHVHELPASIATAQATATDALYPLVQTAHTSSTKTLAAGDAGDIIPLDGASNAIAVTIPHTLFAAGGTGRAWSCGFYVTSVAGGAITFAGSGGIVIKYFGKKPSATAIVAGDTIFVTVVSATLAHVWISAEIP